MHGSSLTTRFHQPTRDGGHDSRSRITCLLSWRDIPLGAFLYQFYLTESSGVTRFSS